MKVSTESDNNFGYEKIAIVVDYPFKEALATILTNHHKFIKYEKRLRKEGKNMFGLPIKQNICKFSASLDA
jgi:hypothetical protein